MLAEVGPLAACIGSDCPSCKAGLQVGTFIGNNGFEIIHQENAQMARVYVLRKLPTCYGSSVMQVRPPVPDLRWRCIPPRRQQQSTGRGGGRNGSQAKPNWKDTMRADGMGERPAWRLTCYGHERDGPNDLEGDVSFEELRWNQLQVCCHPSHSPGSAGVCPQTDVFFSKATTPLDFGRCCNQAALPGCGPH